MTVVETTSSIRLMKSTAYSFIAAIVIQIILQFAFIANFHGKFKVFFDQFSDSKYIAPDIASQMQHLDSNLIDGWNFELGISNLDLIQFDLSQNSN